MDVSANVRRYNGPDGALVPGLAGALAVGVPGVDRGAMESTLQMVEYACESVSGTWSCPRPQ